MILCILKSSLQLSGCGGDGVPRLLRSDHRLQTVAADQTDRSAGTGDCVTAGTFPTVVMGCRGGWDVSGSTVGGVVAACDAHTVGIVAGQLDLLDVIVQNPLKQFVGQNLGSV